MRNRPYQCTYVLFSLSMYKLTSRQSSTSNLITYVRVLSDVTA